MPVVRFLSHGAERSGPPIYLLRLLRTWSEQPIDFTTELVLARPGPLLGQFREVTATTVARLDRGSPERMFERVAAAAHVARIGRRATAAATRARAHGAEPTVTVVNGATAPTVELLRALRPTGAVLTIAHELSTGWFANLHQDDRQFLLRRTERFLAVSRAVERYLVDDLGVPADRVSMIHPPIDLRELHNAPDLGGRPRSLTIGGSGMTDWRKAPELWLRVAAEVKRLAAPRVLRFVWIGGERPGSANFWPLEHEMRHLGLEGEVEFTGQLDTIVDELRRCAVFVSTAREDAYPLACAEAIGLGVPVVGFDGDGVGEMVRESSCGSVVPYPRDDLIASEVVRLLAEPAVRDSAASSGTAFARAHLDVGVIAPAVGDWLMDRVAS